MIVNAGSLTQMRLLHGSLAFSDGIVEEMKLIHWMSVCATTCRLEMIARTAE